MKLLVILLSILYVQYAYALIGGLLSALGLCEKHELQLWKKIEKDFCKNDINNIKDWKKLDKCEKIFPHEINNFPIFDFCKDVIYKDLNKNDIKERNEFRKYLCEDGYKKYYHCVGAYMMYINSTHTDINYINETYSKKNNCYETILKK